MTQLACKFLAVAFNKKRGQYKISFNNLTTLNIFSMVNKLYTIKS